MKTFSHILVLSVLVFLSLISVQAGAQEPVYLPPLPPITAPPYSPLPIDPLVGPNNPGGSGDDRGQAQRQAKCNSLKATQRTLKCSDAALSAPSDFAYLGVDTQRYSTCQLTWSQPLLNFATSLYNNGLQGGRPASDALASSAYRSSIMACKDGNEATRNLCYDQVAVFFGQKTVPIGGDLGDLINTLLGLTPAGADLSSSDAGKLITTYVPAKTCAFILADLAKNACD